MASKASPPILKIDNPGTRQDGTFKSTKDDTTLYYFRYLPSNAENEAPLAHIIFTHGYAEHSGRYFYNFPLFAQANISLTGYDLRGFGLSWKKHSNPKKAHGDTSRKQQFQDLEDLIKIERKRLDENYGKDRVPLFLMGHSMGGGITFAFFTRPKGEEGPSEEVRKMISGVILSSPWLKLANPPPGILFWLAPRILSFYPNFPWTVAVSTKDVSSDKQVQQWTQQDELVDGHVYLRTIWEPLSGGIKSTEEEYKNWPAEKPIIVLHGERDPVTCSKTSKEVIEKLNANDKEFKGWPNLLHECWHEKGDVKVEFIEYIISWVKAHSS